MASIRRPSTVWATTSTFGLLNTFLGWFGIPPVGWLTYQPVVWNDFFWPLIITTNPSMFVINLGISSLVGPYDYQYGVLLSGALLASVPIVIVFLIFQRQFLEGLTQGAVK